MPQMTLAYQAELQRYSKKTRREQFLEEMEGVYASPPMPLQSGGVDAHPRAPDQSAIRQQLEH